MAPEIFAVVMLAALLHASWNALAKARGGVSAMAIGMGSGLISLPALPLIGMPAAASWASLGASALIHVLYFRLVVAAYREGALSVAYPLMRGLPPFAVALVAWIALGESLSVLGWLAMLALGAGVLLLAGEGLRSRAVARKALVLIAANVAVIVAYTTVDGVGARASENAPAYTAWLFVLSALALAPFGGLTALRTAKLQWFSVMVGGACTVGAYGLALWAMSRAPIALVAAAREMSVVFAVILGALFLGERFGALRWVAVCITAAGLVGIRYA